jgi:hypothetical protein
MSFAAKILADPLSPDGVRRTTMEVTFPRIILAEFMATEDADLVRFRRRVSFLDNGCMQWSSVRRDGYGTFTLGDRCYVPQVWLYKRLGGVIPSGWTLDHVCRNRGCVNVFSVQHIEAVPHAVNIFRAVNHRSQVNAKKTHCPKGHAYDAKNTHVNLKGQRICRACWKRWRP